MGEGYTLPRRGKANRLPMIFAAQRCRVPVKTGATAPMLGQTIRLPRPYQRFESWCVSRILKKKPRGSPYRRNKDLEVEGALATDSDSKKCRKWDETPRCDGRALKISGADTASAHRTRVRKTQKTWSHCWNGESRVKVRTNAKPFFVNRVMTNITQY